MVEERIGWQSMIRLAIVVEGKTERNFVKQLLAPHLIVHGVSTEARVIGRTGHQGGNVTVDRIANDVRRLWHNFDAVSTLVDFYGFRQRRTGDVEALQQCIDENCRSAIEGSPRIDRLIVYVQQHEFEALLFSDVGAFRRLPVATEEAITQLELVKSAFPTPEDINDSRQTAPSKRIAKAFPAYSKSEFGPLVAAEIGLDAMRSECPRFGRWVSRLEALGKEGPILR
jgi:hypothetical protein